MGSDMNLRSRVAELQRRQTQLEEDVGPIKAQSEVMELASATIAEEKLALQRAAEIFKREDQELVNRRSRIEKYKSEKIVSVAKLEKVNASIAAYNADVAANNRRREKLIASEKLLNERVEAHNRIVRDSNERVAEFSKWNDEFRLDTLRFEQDIARFKAGCSGERELKKLKD
jgi:chromosome segregation ATPase